MVPAPDTRSVVRLDPAEAPFIVACLADAFADYPVMRWVLGHAGSDDPTRLHTLVHLFVSGRTLRSEPLLGIRDGPRLGGAAIMSCPGRGDPEPEELGQIRERTWTALGGDSRTRYDLCRAAWATMGEDRPHVHLNMIGVRPGLQGRGLAWQLLEAAQQVSRDTPGSEGVTLSTEDPANVTYYQRTGYLVTGRARIAPELETWAMFRPN